jgi:hypothetical protein
VGQPIVRLASLTYKSFWRIEPPISRYGSSRMAVSITYVRAWGSGRRQKKPFSAVDFQSANVYSLK